MEAIFPDIDPDPHVARPAIRQQRRARCQTVASSVIPIMLSTMADSALRHFVYTLLEVAAKNNDSREMRCAATRSGKRPSLHAGPAHARAGRRR
jgi:hypothetical protein